MKFSVFQKYLLLLTLSLGIVSGSYAFVLGSNSFLTSTKKTSSLQSLPNQASHSFAVCDFVETDNDEESDSHQQHSLLILATANPLTLLLAQKERFLITNHYSLPFVPNQKLNILNCTFLI